MAKEPKEAEEESGRRRKILSPLPPFNSSPLVASAEEVPTLLTEEFTKGSLVPRMF